MIAKEAVATQAPANENTIADQEALGLTALAEGVLARDFRPKVATVRRLAEAVLALQEEVSELQKRSKKSAKAKASGGKATTKSGKKKRKLAKIPGQKGK